MRWSFPGSARSAARGRSARRSVWTAAARCSRPRVRPARVARCRWVPGRGRDGGCSAVPGESLGFDAAIALGPYQGPIRQLCLLLKHERNAWLARWLIDLLVEARAEVAQAAGRMRGSCRSRCTGGGAGSGVTTRPTSWRGGWRSGCRCVASGALRRVVATDPLAQMGRVERAQVMRDAFRVRPSPNRGSGGADGHPGR